MPDVALENAMARRAAILEKTHKLTGEINDLVAVLGRARADLEKVEAFIRMWHEMAEGKTLPNQEQKKPEETERAKRIRPVNPSRELVASACVNYIREAGKPVARSELLAQLKLNDIVINGKDPAMVLSTMLWRSKGLIRRLPKGGYWIAGEPIPGESVPTIGELLS